MRESDLLTGRELEAILRRITYKPGYRLEVHADVVTDNVILLVSFEVEDTYGGPRNRVGHRHPVPPTGRWSTGAFLRWLRATLHAIEAHEADEWLKVRELPTTTGGPDLEDMTYLPWLMPFDPHTDPETRRERVDRAARYLEETLR